MSKELAHTSADLAQMQSLPLNAKILMSKQRIKAFYEYFSGGVAVSFSGGKDSTVLLHLVRSVYPDVEAVFVNTGLEYPEVREFAESQENVITLYPKQNFVSVIQKHGYPIPTKEQAHIISAYRRGAKFAQKFINEDVVADSLGRRRRFGVSKRWKILATDAPFKVSAYCCDVMKKAPAKKYSRQTGKKMLVGSLASESIVRKQKWLQNGCNAFNTKEPHSTPLAFWTENDILMYIKENGLQIASVYGDIVPTGRKIKTAVGEVDELVTTGVNRTGCMFCLFGAHLEKGEGRFEAMKRTHPKQYEFCMKPIEEGGLGLKAVIDWCNENCRGVNIKY